MLLACAASSLIPAPAAARTSRPCHRPRRARTLAVDAADDWRDVRAKLVAAERTGQPNGLAVSSSYVFESPLIEQGTVLLDTAQDTSTFALHQQYFHKSLCLLLEHNEEYTKGVLLNRPSGLALDGWRAWFGGDVATGGFFPGGEADGLEREVICLHALEGEAAARLSLPVIRGVSQTSLEGALALVAQGDATREDFWLFVGCAGWGPKQLEAEVGVRVRLGLGLGIGLGLGSPCTRCQPWRAWRRGRA